jgi:hypothetical protein
MTRRSFLLGTGAASFGFARSWEKSEFPDWTAAFVERMLTDSPWARQITVPYLYRRERAAVASGLSQVNLPDGIGLPRVPGWPGRGGGSSRVPPDNDGTPVRTEMYLVVRWASALPVRQALALAQFGRDGLDRNDVREMLSTVPEHYVLEISGFPTTLFPAGPARLEEQLLKTSRLAFKQPALMPISVRVPAHGMHLTAELRFPRTEDSTAPGTSVRLYAEVGTARIEEGFKTKSMHYRGRLEL